MENNLQIIPAFKNNVEAQYVEMMVPLYSYGCERKIKKALSHLKGIYSVNVDYNKQKVTVWGICNKYDVLATVRNKRKVAKFWNPDDQNIDYSYDEDSNDNYESHDDESPKVSSLPQKHFNSKLISFSKRSLSLSKVRSLSWKAMKKVFTRSHSF